MEYREALREELADDGAKLAGSLTAGCDVSSALKSSASSPTESSSEGT